MYNKWAEEAQGQGTLGYLKAGLLIFLPINPHLCLFLFDRGVYDVEPEKSDCLQVTKDDVGQINRLQWFNAFYNVFVGPGVERSDLDGYIENAMEDRDLKKTKLDRIPYKGTEDGKKVFEKGAEGRDADDDKKRELIVESRTVPNIDLSLSIMDYSDRLKLRWRTDGRFKLQERISCIREGWRGMDERQLDRAMALCGAKLTEFLQS